MFLVADLELPRICSALYFRTERSREEATDLGG